MSINLASYKHPLTLSLSLMYMKTYMYLGASGTMFKREGSRGHDNKPMLYQIGFPHHKPLIALIFDNWSSSFSCKHGKNRMLCNSMHYQALWEESCKWKDWPTYFFKYSTLFNDDSKENTIREKSSAVVFLWTQLHVYACNDNR